jgi:hypothetical protein
VLKSLEVSVLAATQSVGYVESVAERSHHYDDAIPESEESENSRK